MSYNRRDFIQRSMMVLGVFSDSETSFKDYPRIKTASSENSIPSKAFTVQDIMDLIFQEGHLNPIPNTVDTLKSGSPDQVVTGIVTTMFATLPIIQMAHKTGSNFIITHEPTYYNHVDSIHFVENNQVLKQKLDILEQNQMVVWRFHDYCHSLKPDAISYGFAKRMGWESEFSTNERILNISKISLRDLIHQLKSRLGIHHVRFMGDIQASCTKIGLIPGAAGGQSHISLLESEKPDVLIVGECPEWETVEYMRDSLFFGNKTSLIILGHGFSESIGMEYFSEWLKPKIPELNINYLPFVEPFNWD